MGEPPRQLGAFVILEKIGEGGMGVVYKARDTRLDRSVAIKLLPEELADDGDRIARLVQEAKAASALNHPNIVTIHEIAEDGGRHYIVMELVDGKPLSEIVPRGGMKILEGLRIGAQIADGLTTAHAAGIVHRDLKPGNVLVDASGRAKIVDFGLAKLTVKVSSDDATLTMGPAATEAGVIVGSAAYMSPEQAEGRGVDARSDIFSFGTVLYEIFSGRQAFRRDTRSGTLAAVVEQEPPPLSNVPPDLERLIARCLRKDVNRRSQSIADVKVALEELRDDVASGRIRVSKNTTPIEKSIRIPRPWLGVAAFLALSGSLSWFALRPHDPPVNPPVELIRVSPDDGYSYQQPALSPDGRFVVYVSNRRGKLELWLQQIGGWNPVPIAPGMEGVAEPQFFPDGSRILFTAKGDGRPGQRVVVTIPVLGGEPTSVVSGLVETARLSPDGREVAYVENRPDGDHLQIVSSDGGATRELSEWARQGAWGPPVWSADGESILSTMPKRPRDPSTAVADIDLYAISKSDGRLRETGVMEVFRQAGYGVASLRAVRNDRGYFQIVRESRTVMVELPLDPRRSTPTGMPRLLVAGTDSSILTSITPGGLAAFQVLRASTDVFHVPLSRETGQPTSIPRRLTQDSRFKQLFPANGPPQLAFLLEQVYQPAGTWMNVISVDLSTAKQKLVSHGLGYGLTMTMALDGSKIAISKPDRDYYSIYLQNTDELGREPGLLCQRCGQAARFTGDGRELLYIPDRGPNTPSDAREKIGIVDVMTGARSIWLEDSEESLHLNTMFADDRWAIVASKRGPASGTVFYLVPWRKPGPPKTEWIRLPAEITQPRATTGSSPFIRYFRGEKLYSVRFDPRTGSFGASEEVVFSPNTRFIPKPNGQVFARGDDLVFELRESIGSVWRIQIR